MKNQDFEEDTYEKYDKLNINVDDLDAQPNNDWHARKALANSWKKRVPYDGIIEDTDMIISDFILSDVVEEDFTVPLEKAASKVLGIPRVVRQFNLNKKPTKTVRDEFYPLEAPEDKIKHVVSELIKFEKRRETTIDQMLGEDQPIFFSFLHKAPVESPQRFLVPLAHPLVKDPRVCVIVPTSQKAKWKKMYPNGDVKIFKVGKFFLRFSEHPAQAKLANSFDYFFFDSNGLDRAKFAKFLGHAFHVAHKIPHPCTMKTWEADKKRICGSVEIQLRLATSLYAVKVGSTELSEQQNVDNILKVWNGVGRVLVSDDIARISIRTHYSPHCFLYVAERIFKPPHEFLSEQKYNKKLRLQLEKQNSLKGAKDVIAKTAQKIETKPVETVVQKKAGLKAQVVGSVQKIEKTTKTAPKAIAQEVAKQVVKKAPIQKGSAPKVTKKPVTKQQPKKK
jgi:hypothetical protein